MSLSDRSPRPRCGSWRRNGQLEEKEHILFLQAKKLVESEEELDFVHVISEYYQGIYVVDLAADQTRSIKVPRYYADLLSRTDHCQSRALDLYCQELMDPACVPAFREVTNYDNIRRHLAEKHQVELLYRKKNDTWLRLRVFAMPGYSQEQQKTLWVFEDDTATVNLRQEEEKAPDHRPGRRGRQPGQEPIFGQHEP